MKDSDKLNKLIAIIERMNSDIKVLSQVPRQWQRNVYIKTLFTNYFVALKFASRILNRIINNKETTTVTMETAIDYSTRLGDMGFDALDKVEQAELFISEDYCSIFNISSC